MGKTTEEIYREYNSDLADAYRELVEQIEKSSPEKVKELEDKNAQLETLNKSLTSDNESINKLYNTTQSENEQLKLRVAELEKKYDDINTVCKGVQGELDKVKSENETLTEAGNKLRNQLEATAKFIPYLMDEVVETVAKNAPELVPQLDAFKLFIRQNQVILSERANAKMN